MARSGYPRCFRTKFGRIGSDPFRYRQNSDSMKTKAQPLAGSAVSPAPVSGAHERYSLVRRLSIVSLLSLFVTATLLVMLYWHDQMKEHSTLAAQENERKASHLMRHLGGYLNFYGMRMDGLDADALRAHPDVAMLDQSLIRHLDERLLKINFYNHAGMVIYSSVHDEVGTLHRNRAKLAYPLQGKMQSWLEFYPTFRTHTGDISERYIVHTYLPLPIDDVDDGVFALYSDITPAMKRVQEKAVSIALIVAAAFAALYAALFFVMRRADCDLADWQDAVITSTRQIALGEARLRAMLDSALDGVIGIDEEGCVIEFNPAAETIFGWHRDEILGQPVHLLNISEHPRTAGGSVPFTHTREPGMASHIETTARRRNGTKFPIDLAASPVSAGDLHFFTTYVRDTTERKRAEIELRIAAIAFESQECMFITNAAGIIQRVNLAFIETSGYDTTAVVGQSPRLWRSGRHDADFYRTMWLTLQDEGKWHGEIWNRRENGEIYPAWLTITAVRDVQGKIIHYVAAFIDITERKAAEEKIKRLAYFDPLTSLPNRRMLQDRLHQALVAGNRSRCYGTLMFIDLDRFKTLNDTMGHDIGDLLLQQVAVRLQECVREENTVARLGGDEFVVILNDLGKCVDEAVTQTRIIGERILAAMNRPYQLGEYSHNSTPSIGVTLFLGHEFSREELMKRADLAMYEAKSSGRNTLCFFDTCMQASVAMSDQESSGNHKTEPVSL